MAVGHGGQILVSGVAAGLVESAGLWRQVRVGVGTCCWARHMSAVEGLELGWWDVAIVGRSPDGGHWADCTCRRTDVATPGFAVFIENANRCELHVSGVDGRPGRLSAKLDADLVSSRREGAGQGLHGPIEVVRGVRKPPLKVHSLLSKRQHSASFRLLTGRV